MFNGGRKGKLFLLCVLSELTGVVGPSGAQHVAGSFTAETVGQGPHLIFLADMGCPPSVYAPFVDSLKKHYTCHLLWIAGFAGTQPSGSDHLLEHIKNDLAFYVRERQLDRPVLIGHGYGALAALWMATQEPNLIGGLLVVNALPFQPAATQPQLSAQMAAPVAKRRQQQLLMFTDEQFEQYQRQRAATVVNDVRHQQQFVHWMKSSDRATLAKATFELMTLDLREQLQYLQAPVLVLIAAGGLVDPTVRTSLLSIFQDQYRLAGAVEFSVHDQSRHFIMLDDPDWFLSQLGKLLSAQSGRN
ncbi:MAG: alpha/beta hydrolase [Chitinophagales bacterium]|nr:alpha/beta hydrolase [Chitinophagales bacterium]MDW8427575.1 alpha/beta hydrolase [Chitinophagales bacterium]